MQGNLRHSMKAYVITTGLVFALITVAHIARIITEGGSPLRQPIFLISSILSAGVAVWAWGVFRRLPRS